MTLHEKSPLDTLKTNSYKCKDTYTYVPGPEDGSWGLGWGVWDGCAEDRTMLPPRAHWINIVGPLLA